MVVAAGIIPVLTQALSQPVSKHFKVRGKWSDTFFFVLKNILYVYFFFVASVVIRMFQSLSRPLIVLFMVTPTLSRRLSLLVDLKLSFFVSR